MKKMYFMNKDDIVSEIEYSFISETVLLTNYISDIIVLPFGIITKPTFSQFLEFLESRCFPKTRYNVKALLDYLGLQCYEPYDIVRKTHGIQNEDTCWIRFEGEELKYDDVKFRD